MNSQKHKLSKATLMNFEPLASLSPARLKELADLCFVENVMVDLDPFRLRGLNGQSVYLVKGELSLTFPDGGEVTIAAGSNEAKYALGKKTPMFAAAKSLTDIQLVRVDDDLLDIMMTWDQLASFRDQPQPVPESDKSEKNATGKGQQAWMMQSGMFSASSLINGAFAQLPPANIEELFKKIVSVPCKKGDIIISEGQDGDYYYVIESGKAEVTRLIGGTTVHLAELKKGDAFGEEALVSNSKRNATITMKSDGILLRLGKNDFNELLKSPLLNPLSPSKARARISAGAVWLDVRYPSEYQHDRLPGAYNIPLGEIRNAIGVLDRNKEYVAYCQSGRRSSAAAFILAQRGYKIHVLEGGVWGLAKMAEHH